MSEKFCSGSLAHFTKCPDCYSAWVESGQKRIAELEEANKKDSEAFKSEFRWRKELEKENEDLKEKLAEAVKALATISDMPVADWCSDLCTKWQPSKIAHETLSRLRVNP